VKDGTQGKLSRNEAWQIIVSLILRSAQTGENGNAYGARVELYDDGGHGSRYTMEVRRSVNKHV
jgi:hypothetical protein